MSTPVSASISSPSITEFRPTPVTILSGFLGSGKTTLLNDLLADTAGLADRRVAVVVNDFSEINIDASLIADQGYVERGEDRFVELTNGCICCTLREDLVESVGRLARSQRFDQIIIESTGISEPMPVAATFEWQWGDGTRLADIAPIDTMVTLVDASQFLGMMAQKTKLMDRDLGAVEGDERTIADLLVDQVEFADKIYITKSDLVPERLYAATAELVRRMNPRSDVEKLIDGKVIDAQGCSCSATTAILGANLYNEDTARAFQGYMDELANPHTPETEEYGISSVIFRGHRPLHRDRLIQALRSTKGLVRSKGYCWISDDLDKVQVWHQAGPDLRIQPASYWKGGGMAPGNEVVLIGVNFDAAAALRRFKDAMLTDGEAAALLDRSEVM